MYKKSTSLSAVALPFVFLSAFMLTSAKTSSLAGAYAACAVLSLIIFVLYLFTVKRKNIWFSVLFCSLTVVNIGYFCLSVSQSLSQALFANRLAYLGSVFLPMSMFFIIINATGIRPSRFVKPVLLALAFVMFFITASQGYLPLYYKDVSFEIVDGVASLEKVYGPLHALYYVYLLGYFATMITFIIRAIIKKTTDTPMHAVFLTTSVFINILVWLTEQFISIDYEILSASYVISGSLLLAVNYIVSENQRLRELLREKESEINATLPKNVEIGARQIIIDADKCEAFCEGVGYLTKTEQKIYNLYVNHHTTKEIMATLEISENTLKFHNKNIYSKLGVTSRRELIEVYNYISKK